MRKMPPITLAMMMNMNVSESDDAPGTFAIGDIGVGFPTKVTLVPSHRIGDTQ
eukprot:CAMPEP_0168581054 /NCGR_PEP_ID=MMETSP0420-20121227/1168_1 /TAXON_ID=498008 /ORGANISM="Pessonella sp." /LENGTH=52 /DNA_ID=CAMNT_0008615297 /DNA_START=363 /DNA_END=521 /DNA_ORIENTATION=-